MAHLDLSHNRLAVLPTTLLRQTPALETLVLDNNLIETIVLEVGPRLFEIKVNSASCSGSIPQMISLSHQ